MSLFSSLIPRQDQEQGPTIFDVLLSMTILMIILIPMILLPVFMIRMLLSLMKSVTAG